MCVLVMVLWHASIIIISVQLSSEQWNHDTEQRLILVSTSFTSSACNPITWCKTDSSSYPRVSSIRSFEGTVPTCPRYFPWQQRHPRHLSASYQLDMTWSRFTPLDGAGGLSTVTLHHYKPFIPWWVAIMLHCLYMFTLPGGQHRCYFVKGVASKKEE